VLEEYLKQQGMRVETKLSENGKKYVVRFKQPNKKIDEILAIAKDVQKHLTQFDYVIIKVAKSGGFLVELVITYNDIYWRVAKGPIYLDILNRKDITDLEKILNNLKKVVN